MVDEHLRDLERRWKESGSLDDVSFGMAWFEDED